MLLLGVASGFLAFVLWAHVHRGEAEGKQRHSGLEAGETERGLWQARPSQRATSSVPLSPSVSPSVSTTLDPQRLGSGKETHPHETRDASKQRARRVARISRPLARTDEGTSGTEWPCSTNREEGITLEPFHQRMAREETSIRTKATATATTRIKPTRCCCPVLSWRHRSSAVRADID